MDLELHGAQGLPEDAMISVRAGQTRRQALVKDCLQGSKIKFPSCPEENTTCTLKVDILDVLGSARFSCNASEMVYDSTNLPVEPTGAHPSGMQVQFTLKRSQLEGAEGTYAGHPSRHDGENSTVYKERKEMAAKEYLDDHGLVSFMHFLMQSLMKDKPEDPYAFLQKQISLRVDPADHADRGLSKGTGFTNSYGAPADPFNVVPVPVGVPGEDRGLERLMQKLSPEGSPVVTADQLKDMENDATEAGDRLRRDNSSLRECADQLKVEYAKLVEESSRLRHQVAARDNSGLSPIASAPQTPANQIAQGETQQLTAYREIAVMQDEVAALARENSELVFQLGSIRAAIDELRMEMEQEMRG